MIGIDILNPNTVVVKSILLTSIRIRGRNLFQGNQLDYEKGLQHKHKIKRKGIFYVCCVMGSINIMIGT